MALGFTTEQLEKLEEAIARGVRRVKYTDKEVWYNSIDEMLRLRELIRRELGLAAKSKRLYSEFDKGLT